MTLSAFWYYTCKHMRIACGNMFLELYLGDLYFIGQENEAMRMLANITHSVCTGIDCIGTTPTQCISQTM